jgi:hypothetical protein
MWTTYATTVWLSQCLVSWGLQCPLHYANTYMFNKEHECVHLVYKLTLSTWLLSRPPQVQQGHHLCARRHPGQLLD